MASAGFAFFHGPPNSPATDEFDQETPARRQIRELAESAPPLSEQQRDRLRVLLDLTDGGGDE